jgi:iron complex outermembrane receptor protein
LQGITNRDGDANAKPSKGRGWSVGFDLAPDFLPGFNMSFSLWHTSFLGGITGPSLASSVDSKSLNSTVTFYPNCATPAEIAALQGAIPQSGPLPPCAQYLFANANSNYFNLRIQGIDANFNYKYDVGSWGTAKIGDNVTQYLSFTEAYGVEAQGVPFNILNTAGFNTGFPSVATQMRGNIGWILDGVEADLFVNFTSGYANWNGNSINPIILGAAGTPEIGNPIGGGDHVPAYISYDLHLSYAFSGGILGDDQITLTGRNILNETPPFYNSSTGYDAFISNALGRVIEIGLVAKY